MPTNQNTCTYIYQLQCVAIDVLAGLGSLDQTANKDKMDKNGLKIKLFLWKKAVLHPKASHLYPPTISPWAQFSIYGQLPVTLSKDAKPNLSDSLERWEGMGFLGVCRSEF